MTDIRLSVALITRNRPDSLRRCLKSLRSQDVQPYEVIVSDDSEQAFTQENRSLAERFGCRYIAGPRRGLYANRNFAALQCEGSHVRTMDDDHTFPPGHFGQCITAVHGDPKAIWTTGEAGLIDGKIQARADTATQLHCPGVGGPVGDPDDNWAISDGSTIYPREIFDSGLRITENFSYGPSYLEFGAYLYHHGWRSRCISGAWVEHHLDPTIPPRNDAISRLYASLCFNLYFRPDAVLLCRYLLAILVRNPGLVTRLPGLLSLAHKRWSVAHE